MCAAGANVSSSVIIVGVLLVEAPVERIFREGIVWTRRRRASGRSVIGVCRVLLAEPEPEVVVARLIFIRNFMLSVGVDLLSDFDIKFEGFTGSRATCFTISSLRRRMIFSEMAHS